ncbi:selenophosphate synthetase [Salmonella enterica subsp. salamae]|nr:selenophosphate synthetase [Salmonella enterica subsp. salamae]
MSEQAIRLTQYSHGAGCGCKISPKVLETILHSEQAKFVDPNLLVGNETRDDAAVYDLGNGTSIISTTDFFMPIVDNPFDFGRIAATNAISDIFAMGGKPIMAIAILGWPINTLSPDIAREVTEGGVLPAVRPVSRWRVDTLLTPRSRSLVSRSQAWCRPNG